jgi:D-sedoheptulose 7-phosphate isomerase
VERDDTSVVRGALDESIAVKERCKQELVEVITRVAAVIGERLRADGKVVLFGNGGSAADAQHLAAEFVGRFRRHRRPLAALALTTDTSCLTAISNDFGFDEVFARQVHALVGPGDVVIGLSTSGTSNNVVRGLEVARSKGATVIALTGQGGGRLRSVADTTIMVPSDSAPRVQEAHITIGHILCDLVERELRGEETSGVS